MARYFIFISFKGTYYHGWQLQPNSVTVQKIIDETLSLILGEKITSTGAGRTDAGVHAIFFCAHFDSHAEDLAGKKNLIFRLNRYLPEDISVTGVKRVIADANARYSAISRTYRYLVSRIKDPFSKDSSWYIHGDLDIEMMNKAADILLRYSDFTSFSRLHSNNKTNICKIYSALWKPEGDRLVFTIKADRFLRNMVRAIVGTIITIGMYKTTLQEFEEIILSKNRSAAGTSAPAKGLFLIDIEYPDEVFMQVPV